MGTPFDPFSGMVRMNAIIGIVVVLICMVAVWWALQQVRWEVFLKNAKSPQAKGLQMILTIILGYELARFIMDYLGWSLTLQMLF
ncbi:MAG TPA: DUF1146 family protein [Bacilli bacterium]